MCSLRPGMPVSPRFCPQTSHRFGWYGEEYSFRVGYDEEAPGGKAIRPSLIKPDEWVFWLIVYKSGGRLLACWQREKDFIAV